VRECVQQGGSESRQCVGEWVNKQKMPTNTIKSSADVLVPNVGLPQLPHPQGF
jgi:hypothetical protein